MSYIVGFRLSGVHSIISDTRLTKNGRQGQNICVKTGVLFPGCIYGLTGDAAHGFKFINDIKNALTKGNNTLASWRELNDLISFYNFSKRNDNHFKILLSTRSSGKPEFYVLDSHQGLSYCENDWVSLGTGRPFLDPLIEKKYTLKIAELQQKIKDLPEAGVIYPYFLCLWLSELSLTFGRIRLEQMGVGGVFNFVYQTASNEFLQKPSIYVFSDIDLKTRKVHSWMYRVCRVQEGLYIRYSDPMPGDEYDEVILFDPASVPPKVEIQNKEQFEKQVLEEIDSQPSYFFCGFGYTNPIYQYGHECHILLEDDQDKPAITENGEIAPELQKLIADHFLSRKSLPGQGEGVRLQYFTRGRQIRGK